MVMMEQNHDVGGQWLYDPNVEGEDPLGRSKFLKVHSSIYASLRLASPREIVGFSDFPFVVKKGRDTRRFPGHRELLWYLEDFCEWFGLRETIRFNTKVEYVGMLDSDEVGGGLKWVVRSRDVKSEKAVEEVFDAVVVATGQYSHPRLPSIKGMSKPLSQYPLFSNGLNKKFMILAMFSKLDSSFNPKSFLFTIHIINI